MSDRDLARKLTEGVLERAVHNIEANLTPVYEFMVELVVSTTGSRMYRVSHPTQLDEPLYVRVGVDVMDRIEAREYLPPQDPAVVVDDEPTQIGLKSPTWGPWGPEGRPDPSAP